MQFDNQNAKHYEECRVTKKYLKLFENCYKEPQEIVTLETFGSKSVENIRGNQKNNALKRKESTSSVTNSKSAGEKERKKRRGIVKSHDIKSMFKNTANKRKVPKENEDDIVVILDQSSLFQMLFYFKEKSIKKTENNTA